MLVAYCPGGWVTGGPEALHQLVHVAGALNIPATICYYDAGKGMDKPAPYSRYDTGQIKHVPLGAQVVVPETKIELGLELKERGHEVYVWWLGVPNGLPALRQYPDAVKGLIHLAQSRLAADTLRAAGLDYIMLSDYTRMAEPQAAGKKQNVVAYNPSKYVGPGLDNYPGIEFVPIQSMSFEEVTHTLARAKVYLDCGYHPGKDRLPREAAMQNCLVVTNSANAAGNCEDIPIPREYKQAPFDSAAAFHQLFHEYTERVLSDFAYYRRVIGQEKAVFRAQVAAIFGEM
jgi:hypothetical protein